MSDIVKSIGVIEGEGDQLVNHFEATLYDNAEVVLHMEDGENGVDGTYSLDEIREIMAALGHLLWVAENGD